ncbi:MAG: exonuclease domain-containing protein [Eubacteriales bacterium]
MNNKTSIIKEEEYVIVDIETTGFSVEYCHIIEISVLKVLYGEIVDRYHTYVKQSEPIPAFITRLTGITDNDVEAGKLLCHAIKEFAEFVGDLTIVGHNISFDYRFLNHDCERLINRTIRNERIDTMRLSKTLISDIPNFKLGTLISYFKIADLGQHSAINDTQMTYELIKSLSDLNDNYREKNIIQIQCAASNCNLFYNKKIVIKTKMKYVQPRLLECVFSEMNSNVYYSLYSSCNILIMNESTYNRFCIIETFEEVWEPWLNTAKQRFMDGTLKIYSEKMVCELLNIQIVEKKSLKWGEHVALKDLIAALDEPDENHPLYKKNCVFTGTLDRYDRKTAMQLVTNVGGVCQSGITKDTDFLILGDNSFCASIKGGRSSKQMKAEKMIMDGSDIQIISESTFSQILKSE